MIHFRALYEVNFGHTIVTYGSEWPTYEFRSILRTTVDTIGSSEVEDVSEFLWRFYGIYRIRVQ